LPRGGDSGIVKDDFAQGVPNATVRVSQLQRQNGQPIAQHGDDRTDRRPRMYRAFGLAPAVTSSPSPPPTLGGGRISNCRRRPTCRRR
jgi:hypothetical protein